MRPPVAEGFAEPLAREPAGLAGGLSAEPRSRSQDPALAARAHPGCAVPSLGVEDEQRTGARRHALRGRDRFVLTRNVAQLLQPATPGEKALAIARVVEVGPGGVEERAVRVLGVEEVDVELQGPSHVEVGFGDGELQHVVGRDDIVVEGGIGRKVLVDDSPELLGAENARDGGKAGIVHFPPEDAQGGTEDQRR